MNTKKKLHTNIFIIYKNIISWAKPIVVRCEQPIAAFVQLDYFFKFKRKRVYC
jgi:hypothetical protein